MVLKLYGTPYAFGATAVVAMVLLEKHIPFEFVLVDLKTGAHKTREFRERHPFGNVPCIEDDGFIVYESRAIARYLADKYADQDHGPRLIPVPTKVQERAVFEQGASVENVNFFPSVLKVIQEKFEKPLHGETTDEVALAGYIAELSKVLSVYDDILSKQRFMGGDEFSLVDIFHVGTGPGLALGGIDVMISTGPNVARWWNDVISRPSWVKLQAEGIKSSV
ncbi:glutathione S-transferase [Roridomyces roridus]|uniref:glutathione transferase n=1 Tax=Roridomyces roridus TaxID=1738132 RepID=A0AAD7B9N8_9AGAR|nr:glutathione S-transferase [Roridomyces roridus]